MSITGTHRIPRARRDCIVVPAPDAPTKNSAVQPPEHPSPLASAAAPRAPLGERELDDAIACVEAAQARIVEYQRATGGGSVDSRTTDAWFDLSRALDKLQIEKRRGHL